MDRIVQHISSSKNGTLSDIRKMLNGLESNEKVLISDEGALDTALMSLDATQCTAGFMHLLYFKALRARGNSTPIKDHNVFVNQCTDFFGGADPEQFSLVAEKARVVVQQLRESVLLCDAPIRGIVPLRAAVALLQAGNENLLTPAHAELALVCLKSKCFSHARNVLDAPVYEVQPKEHGLTPEDYLRYHFYAGNLYVGLKEFARAVTMYQLALTMPSQALSAIQVASYKRYVLCSLLLHGEVRHLPENLVDEDFVRALHRHCKIYNGFADAFKRGHREARKFASENAEVMVRDTNHGLLKQVLSSIVRRSIQRLTNTYVTVQLAEIAQRCELKGAGEAEQHVRAMIEDGQVFARIDKAEGVVRFESDPERYDTSAVVGKLDGKLREAMALTERLRNADRAHQTSQDYVQKVVQLKKRMRIGDDNDVPLGAIAGVGGGMKGGPRGGGNGGMTEAEAIAMAMRASANDM